MEHNQTDINKHRKNQINEIQIAGLSCKLYLPADYNNSQKSYPVIYVNGEIPIDEVVNEIRKTNVSIEFLLLSIQPTNWNDDFTPWSAPAFRKGEAAPAGKADNYIYCLTEEIKPLIDANYRTKPEPEHTILLGYSLGGLAALYSCYKTDVFGLIGSLSGSLWYDNFCEYMEQHKPLRNNLKVYLSLGRKECLSKNPRRGKVADCTEQAREILIRQLSVSTDNAKGNTQNIRINGQGDNNADNVFFEWNDGGHFYEIPKRFAKAIAWCKINEI